MRLHVLGSGSRGNSFALDAGGRVLLLDAGFSARELCRRLEAHALAPGMLVGVALTHEHGDHATGAVRLARKLGIPVACSDGTWRGLGAPADVPHRRVAYGVPAAVGDFVIEGAGTSHDAREPLALAVRVGDGPRLGLAYDLGRPTVAVRHLLRACAAIVLEANHDEYLLRISEYPAVVRQRIAGSGGHLSNRAAGELLAELCHEGLALVVLAHLSQRCNDAATARAAVAEALGAASFRGQIHVASQECEALALDLMAALAAA